MYDWLVKNNYAFIDAQNVHRGIKNLGWKIDWAKFRVYLKDKYFVTTAYIFIGRIEAYQNLYIQLEKAGYMLIFKPITVDSNGKIKGNCDADLVLLAVSEQYEYDKAVIISSDGDFYSLVRYLYKKAKLEMVLSPDIKTCSMLLRTEAMEKINYLNNLKGKVGINEKAPHEDETS